MRQLLGISLLIFAGANSLFAQESSAAKAIPVPSKWAHWAIEFSYDHEQKDADGKIAPVFPPRLAKGEYWVTGTTARADESYQGGLNRSVYQWETYELTHPLNSEQVFIEDLTDQPIPFQLFRRYFPGFDWVKPANFSGLVSEFGQVCRYYRETERVENGKAPLDDALQVDKEAWISEKTGLPVAYRIGGQTGKYLFLENPPAAVELPENYLELIRSRFKAGPTPGQEASFRK